MKTAREIAFEVINETHQSQCYVNLLLPKVLSRTELTDQDRALVTELVYGTLRNQGTLDWVVSQYSSQPIEKIPLKALDILRLGAYQLFYLAKIPPYAAVNESVELAKKSTHAGMVKFINGLLREISLKRAEIKLPDREKDGVAYLSIAHSHPTWLVEKWIKEIGFEQTETLVKANNLPPKVSIRTNTLKITPGSLIALLRLRGIEAEASLFVPEGIVVKGSGDLGALPEFKEGFFVVQGEASMLVSYVVSPKPGEIVLDLCAAPGGKATHLAQLMRDQGRVIAIDIHLKRLALIDEAAKRLGIKIVETGQADATKLSSKMVSQADRVLVDAPCSGLGVLAKRPDARWRKTPGRIEELVDLQLKLVESASRFLKKEGVLVYSTCTISKEENEQVVEKFLSRHPEFSLDDVSLFLPGRLKSKEPWVQLYPQRYGLDGIFIARMIRT